MKGSSIWNIWGGIAFDKRFGILVGRIQMSPCCAKNLPELFVMALALNPSVVDTHSNLGNVYNARETEWCSSRALSRSDVPFCVSAINIPSPIGANAG